MSRALISALGGLQTHQGWIDVIGNNLANSNTTAFKASRALFAAMLARTVREGTGPSGTLGGTNPVQVGLGSRLSYVGRDFGQGALRVTGRTFDLAMLGRGFYAVENGNQTLYTRVGSFGLDAEGNMVDLRTGYRVLDPNGQTLSIDTGSVVPPQATAEITHAGNLPSVVEGPLAEELTSTSALYDGQPAVLAASVSGPYAVPIGETWTMELTVDGGAPDTVSVTSTTGTVTAAEVAAAIDALDHVSAVVGTGGNVELTTDKTGAAATLKVSPGAAGQDLASLVGFSTSLVTGTETLATGASNLNALTLNDVDYQTSDAIEVSGSDAAGNPVLATFVYGVDGTTVDDLVAFVDGQYPDATAAFDPLTGQITLTADGTGEAELSLVLSDPASQTGASSWSKAALAVTTNGTGPDTATTSIEVFDAAGASHVLTFEYERQDDGTWTLTTTLPPSEGTVLAGTIAGITFNDDGSLLSPPSGTLQVQFANQPAQSIAVALGTPGAFDGLTEFGQGASVVATDQDGYGAGELANLSVAQDGTIEGFYTNGEVVELGAFGIATFANDEGLEEVGDNYWTESANSGQRILGAGQINGAGDVIGGSLEESNVDTATEFVDLIRAQRGFQANARVVSVQDEMLEEIVNVV
ncbi:MAG TPA: flagellar hook-basal body complex protein [Planctomycetota bacterium]|nr:flagellar hook-basal body complex protein [Planctomycetota bacterium]